MAVYHIEFRIRGHAKRYAKALVYDVGRRFRVRGMTRRHVVPHISLYGPFLTRRQKDVVAEVVRVCSKYELVPFYFRGFNYFDNPAHKVIYLDILPSDELVNLRYELARALLPITYSKSNEDRKLRADFKFHSTIAFKDIDNKFDDIWEYISRKEKPNIKQQLLRVTIIKNSKILYEYDLLQHKLLTRRQALDRHIFMETIRELNSKQVGREVIRDETDNEIELEREEDGVESNKEERISLLDIVRNLFR
jgi:hypothetical protein